MAEVGTKRAKRWKATSKVEIMFAGWNWNYDGGHTTEDSGCHGVREVPAVQLVDVIEWGLFHEHGNGL